MVSLTILPTRRQVWCNSYFGSIEAANKLTDDFLKSDFIRKASIFKADGELTLNNFRGTAESRHEGIEGVRA